MKYLIFTIFFLLIPVSHAATVSVKKNDFGQTFILIDGNIEKGDFKKVVENAKSFYVSHFFSEENLIFQLNSPGGNVQEAIKIGRFFRESLSKTVINGNSFVDERSNAGKYLLNELSKGEDGFVSSRNVLYSSIDPVAESDIIKCYSACVLMFLAGVEKQLIDNYYTDDSGRADYERSIPVIGLHRPYYDKLFYSKLGPIEAQKAYKELEALVKDYLKEIDVSNSIVERMFRASSDEIDLISSKKIEQMTLKEEPFIDEWLKAKCGDIDDGKSILSALDYQYKKEMMHERLKKVKELVVSKGGTPFDYLYIHETYEPKGYSKEKYDRLVKKITTYNRKVNSCKKDAVHKHQRTFVLNSE